MSVNHNENGDQIREDVDRFRSIQTASGVFISALETSHDWLTSYDCLGLMKNCSLPEHFETSAVREEDQFDEAPDEDEDLDARFNPPSDSINDGSGEQGHPGGGSSDEVVDEMEDNPENTPEDTPGYDTGGASKEHSSGTNNNATTNKMAGESDRKKTKATKGKDPGGAVSKGFGDDPVPSKGKNTAKGKAKKGAENTAAKKGTKNTTAGESWESTKADINYPYKKREFCLPKKTRKLGIRVAYESTTLAEVRPHGTDATLHGWRSLAIPIIEETQGPKNLWNTDRGVIDNGGASDPNSDEDGESDNERDFFYQSYEQGSFPNGRPAVAPEDEDTGIYQENVSPGRSVPAPVVPAEDDRAAGDADDMEL
ncbi:hypothetical protein G6011_11780 [Alternaria panax]|uniref:Uncharacterized protein n=1 Tax=Alternaria panax TaxID=48097 RepID=A0AAD4I0U8_9PLEO|nr:hypothetical protein G6011_11780 [Alternaria panax]